ncbi:FkbH-like protein [Algoriphagus sp. 4150]|uniref:HAD-IIIC family phosphatase n=1 Tax=Algoriphagus sp. 4150 TaxID=2817756 RepID=UPI00285CE468|nr:HAD-IIIC family phosphatase [Algoriphagus sp. 4150]MDR7132690.1 FkbH-like protein [Algoriphagus sp. 4150]
MEANLAYKLRELSYLDILKNNTELSKSKKERDFTITILCNITLDPIKEILEFYLRSFSYNPIIKFGNYQNIVQDTFNIQKSDLVIVFYELINISENFHLIAELMSRKETNQVIENCKIDIDLILKNLRKKNVLINVFSSYPFTGSNIAIRTINKIVTILNQYLEQKKTPNVQLIDINRISNFLGSAKTYDFQKFKLYKSLYSIEFLKHYVSGIENILLRHTGKLKKALIFDCDNTLWKGVAGEEGDNITMSAHDAIGVHFHLVQKIAVSLSRKGVLIGLCSKNNSQDIEHIFSRHQDVVIGKDEIVIMKVNWNTKDENLRAISQELNIGLDSIVFVDDSEFEIELVKANLPEVLALKVPNDICQYPAMIIETAQRYFNLHPNKEDLNRTKTYKDQATRRVVATSFTNIDSYLKTLQTQLIISKNYDLHIPRISQLMQKTNQFNLTTHRYSETEVNNLINEPIVTILSMDVTDCFGPMGISGVVILREWPLLNTSEIDSFLLSCRVLGRKIEVALLDYVIKFCRANGYQRIIGTYIKTEKNGMVTDFYDRNQFTKLTSSEKSTTYSLNISSYRYNNLNFISILDSQ